MHCNCNAFNPRAICYDLVNKESDNLNLIQSLKEGQSIEIKENLSNKLDRELVAFANANGGTIYCGITDNGKVSGIKATNKILGELQDIARNCDPTINGWD